MAINVFLKSNNVTPIIMKDGVHHAVMDSILLILEEVVVKINPIDYCV